jgi:methylmalonyl-CoA/ethylmalonyl-CoA epimerase
MADIKKIHHVAIVVDSISEATAFWQDLGLKVDSINEVPEQESKVAFLSLGDAEIELVQPISETSGIARYLAKHGPGMHHICIEVEDIESILINLQQKNYKLINPVAQLTENGRKYAFIHPQSTKGVLVELYE